MRLSLLLLLLSCVTSYKILVYIPKFAISHIKFMGKIADTLVDAGHNVTALVSEMDDKLTDGTKKAEIIRVSPGEGANYMNTHWVTEGNMQDIFDVDMNSYAGFQGAISNAYSNSVSFSIQCRKLLSTPGLVERLKNEKYDAFITENFERCGVGLSYLVSARALIPVSSTFFYDSYPFGLYYSLLTEHSVMSDGRFVSSISTRLSNFYHWFVQRQFDSTQDRPQQKIFDELYPVTPSFSTILSNAAVAFPNTEPLIDFARPTISKIVPIGGLTVENPKPLDEHWDSLLSLRSKTVLVSFGSIAKSAHLSPARKNALLEAFASFPDTTFIWKYENNTDDFAKKNVSNVPNIVLTDWMPQLDILADHRLTLFISHAGMASCHEIAHFGVPSMLVPIFGDQTHNAAALAHVGIAQVFSRFDMVDPEKIREAIAEILSDSKYKETAMRIRDQLAAAPTSPVERLVKNVEFVARFGPSKSLRPLNLGLSTIQFYGIDLIAILLCSVASVILSVVFIYKLIVPILRNRTTEKLRKE